MKQTVTLPAHLFQPSVAPPVAVVERWEKALHQAVMPGETLCVLLAGGASVVVASPTWGVLTKKCVLPGEAVEAGEPVAVLGGVSAPLTPDAPPALSPLIPNPQSLIPTCPVAAHHARSLRTTPHGYAVTIADVSEPLRLIERARRGETVSGVPESLSLLPFVLRAVASALSRFAPLNVEQSAVHLGLELANGAVPVVPNADRLSVWGAAREVLRLEQAIADGTLARADVSGATFTVSVAPGVLWRTPVLHTPLAGHLCFGKTVGGAVHLCLAYAVERVDAADAEASLGEIAQALESGDFLLGGA